MPPFCGPRQRPWPGRARGLLEGAIQGFEERHPLREQRLIVGVRELQSLNHDADSGDLGGAKASILQIEVVNNAGHSRNGGFLDAEHRAQRFNGAVLR